MKVSIVIPTISGREEYLERCINSYQALTEVETEFLIYYDELTGGIGWRKGSEESTGDYLHFTNDDIVPGENWLEPCVKSVEKGNVPVVIIAWTSHEMLNKDMYPKEGKHFNEHTSHFEGYPRIQPIGRLASKKNESEYPSLPFCSAEQWENIKPMISSHYGTDRWFGRKAKEAGYQNECVESYFYHYSASIGRDGKIDTWLGQDRLTFDLQFSYPMYLSGELDPSELHPEWNTDKGRKMSRDWYIKHVPRGTGYPWEIVKGYE